MSPITFMCGIATGSVVATGVAMLLDYFAERLRGKREQVELNPAPVADDSTQSILDIDSELQGVGPLFGLHPPEGCVFEVIRSDLEWGVIIHRTSDSTIKFYGFCFDEQHLGDVNAIRSCAKNAIKKYEKFCAEESRVKTYCGTYPPKDTRTTGVAK